MIERARDGGGPSLVHVKLNRYFGHFEGDAMTYRGAGRGGQAARDQGSAAASSASAWSRRPCSSRRTSTASTQEVKSHIDQVTVEAKAAPMPTEKDLLTDVYVSY